MTNIKRYKEMRIPIPQLKSY